MKINSEIIWAAVLIVTAVGAYYFGAQAGIIKTEETLEGIIQEKVEEITVLEGKIHQLSEELKSRGIYSYPQANIVSEKGDSTATVLITLNGKDAIEDLRIERSRRMYDSENGRDKSGKPKATTSYVGTLTAHNPVAFEIEEFDDEMGVNLTFKSDENQWQQYLRMRKTPMGEIRTFWVITNGDSEVIDKHIDEGFLSEEDESLILSNGEKLKYSDIKMNSVFKPGAAEK